MTTISFSFVILTSRLEATRWRYFGMDLVILSRGQMTRPTPDMVPPLQTSSPHQREDIYPRMYDLTFKMTNTRPIFSGIRFETWNPPARSRDLTTRPSRLDNQSEKKLKS
ncbi:hypothetical protein AVEN_275673-1 [Araneus ventricosus]|uniref:Uncharacterized protein n=1 Tax=Araneus ventricosus TaxID=182803 RepID=A0A4Y2MG52_ARAVE|nr:hypothetical protein AVEN_275673-1 [Araneus ventricosus]